MKRNTTKWSVALLAILFVGVRLAFADPNTTHARGDVNGDGQIDIADITALVNKIANPSLVLAGEPDVNNDGEVNQTDIDILEEYIHNGTAFPKQDRTLSFATPTSVAKTYGDADFTNAATLSAGTGSITYTSSNTSVATVNSTTGLVHIVGAGTTTITASSSSTDEYYNAPANTSYTVTITKASSTLTVNTAALSFSASEGQGSTKTKTGVSCNAGGTISVSSSNTSYCTASISGSTITVTRKSEEAFSNVTITVSSTADGNHNKPSSATFKVSAAKKMTSATTSDIGKVVCSNGHIHSTVSAIDCGGSERAMIAYISSTGHGLAFALEDASSSSVTWSNAASTVSSWASSKSVSGVSGGAWRLPSANDFKYMFQGCGGSSYTSTLTDGMSYSHGNIQTMLTSCGGKSVNNYPYWSSTNYQSNYWAWEYYFQDSKFLYYETTGVYRHIRAVFAF